MFILRTFMLLALVVWLGGIIFFAFVFAPTAFHMLVPQLAGRVVGPSLAILHWMGIASALVFLLCSLIYSRVKFAYLKAFSLANLLVVVMLVLTCISQFGIMPKMETIRKETHFWHDTDPSILAWPQEMAKMRNQVLPPLQAEFDRLHRWSERIEGGVLVLGVVVLVLTARRFN